MLRFAPRYGRISPSLVQPWQVRQLRRGMRAGNDNAPQTLKPRQWDANDATLEAALRLFAVHGLSAARRAGEEAEDARVAGDLDKARWWIAVCRTLDRSMARRLSQC